MIEVRNLVKRYGDHLAVDDLSFTVEQGQIYGFLGPNGAGKSTTMNILTGCLAATSGEVVIDGHDIYKEPKQAKALIGYLPEQPPLYPDMTPKEYLLFVAQMKGVGKKARAEAVLSVMEKTGVLDVQDRLIKNLSKGYKQRVGLAQAILGDPKVIILDEPTVGLDPAQIIEIRGVIRSLAEDHTVIFSSHILSEVNEICSRVLIIAHGKLVAENTPEELESSFVGTPTLTVTAQGEAEAVEAAVQTLEGVDECTLSEPAEDGTITVRLQYPAGTDVKAARIALSKVLSDAGCLILGMEESKASLEDVFMELISQDADLTAQPEETDEDDEPLEVDAEALLSGNIGSAYDEHEAFDAPYEDDDADDADGYGEEYAEEDADVEAAEADAEDAQTQTLTLAEETAEEITGEEADNDAGNV